MEVVTRNIAAGALSQNGASKKAIQKRPIVEFYANDDLGDPTPMIMPKLCLATDAQVAEIKACALKINEILKAFLAER